MVTPPKDSFGSYFLYPKLLKNSLLSLIILINIGSNSLLGQLSINIKYLLYLMETKEQLVNNIKEWIKIDNEIPNNINIYIPQN